MELHNLEQRELVPLEQWNCTQREQEEAYIANDEPAQERPETLSIGGDVPVREKRED